MTRSSTTNCKNKNKKPLLCVFYAEFDNAVGPKICFQHPKGFMDICILNYDKEVSNHHNCDLVGDSPSSGSDTRGGHAHHADISDCRCCSLFSVVSDFCIAGPELADTVLCVSTHGMHVLTMPSIIYNEELYERNSLMFSIGFVLRGPFADDKEGAVDDVQLQLTRPYRPLLFKTVETLRTAEIESQYLTRSISRASIQHVLCQIYNSLNCMNKQAAAEANIMLNEANVLHLKLFKSPKPLTPPVPDFVVPVLLRPEFQLQMFDWDLTINWIVPHIDGVKTTKAISEESEVDLEMVRACLRVLRHHGVLTFVDVFQYSNHYESTSLAAAMLNGLHPKLLNAAFHFAVRGGINSSSIHQNLCFQSSGRSSSFASHNSEITTEKVSSSDPKKITKGDYTGTRDSQQRYSLSSSPQVVSSPKLHPIQHNGSSSSSQNRKNPGNEYFANKLGSLTEDITVVKSSFDESQRVMIQRQNDLARFYCLFKRVNSLQEFIIELVTKSVEWKDLLDFFDMRRCIIFGIIHGLIVRVHDFPLAMRNQNYEHNLIEKEMEMVDKTSNNVVDRILIEKVVDAMDGTKRDDELCCLFNLPFRSVLEVPYHRAATSGIIIMHNYSPSPSNV